MAIGVNKPAIGVNQPAIANQISSPNKPGGVGGVKSVSDKAGGLANQVASYVENKFDPSKALTGDNFAEIFKNTDLGKEVPPDLQQAMIAAAPKGAESSQAQSSTAAAPEQRQKGVESSNSLAFGRPA